MALTTSLCGGGVFLLSPYPRPPARPGSLSVFFMPIEVGAGLSKTQQTAELSPPFPPLSLRPHPTLFSWVSSGWARGS